MKKLCLLFLLIFASRVLADSTPVLSRTGKTFDPSIPTLRSVLGYDFGEQITRHSSMERYIDALAKSSSKIKIQKIGETYEGRSLYYLIISSPENMARLEELRAANVRLADPRKISSQEADKIIQNNPVFVGLSYSVHGAEHSGTETALALAYYLIASTDAETQNILQKCVILIDPMENPDGRERFISYFYSTVGKTPNADPNAAEHNQAWPGGRYNHYLFDMNRDWAILSQKETRARIKAYQQYHPEIFIDVHEMTEDSSYFFPPPSVPHNPNIPPNMVEWWNKLGKAVSSEFDRNGIEYFTQERFDFWYPGYGDSWPTYNGALAGTFEQGSVRGLIRKRYDEKIIHYHDAIWHHFVSTLATCKLAATNREQRLRDFYRFRASAVDEGRIGPIRQYIIRRSTDPNLADGLVEKLMWQGVEVHQATKDFRVEATSYYVDGLAIQNFHSGDYILSLEQPLKRLLRALFDKETLPDKKFLEEEEQRRKDKEPSEFYDISAWSLPLAYHLDAYWSAEAAPSNGTILLAAVPQEKVVVPEASFAYLLNYDTNQMLRAASELLARNIRIYFSTKNFGINGSEYNAGSLIIKTHDNPENLRSQLQEISNSTGVHFGATNTGWTPEGPDLGSNDVYFVQKPKIAVLTQMPADPTSFGAIEYLLDQRYQFPFTSIPAHLISDIDLKDYNVIVLPDEGGGSSYKSIVGDEGIKKLKEWVDNGGTLIAVAGAASFLVDNGELTSIKRINKFKRDSAEEVPEKKDDEEQTSSEEETESPDVIPGAIGRVKLNPKDFLSFGYKEEEIPVFLYSSNVFEAPPGVKAAAVYPEASRLKVSGLIWDISRQRLQNKVYASEESTGEGHVILFAEDPTFRAYWEGLDRIFFNGVFFGPSL